MKPEEFKDALSAFTEETLSEMGMENVEGGFLDNVKVNLVNCTIATNNCGEGSNCYDGCGKVSK